MVAGLTAKVCQKSGTRTSLGVPLRVIRCVLFLLRGLLEQDVLMEVELETCLEGAQEAGARTFRYATP